MELPRNQVDASEPKCPEIKTLCRFETLAQAKFC